MPQSVFILPDKRKLKICDGVPDKMFSFSQDNPSDVESGGIMVGRILEIGSDYVIDDVSHPMVTDIQTRNRFVRKSAGHQDFFNHYWEQTDGRCFYLGEWHTHPERTPKPSQIDLRGWKKLLRVPVQDQTQLFFIIVGTKESVIWHGENINNTIIITRLGQINRQFHEPFSNGGSLNG